MVQTNTNKLESLPRSTRKRATLGGVAEADHAAERERRAGLRRRRHQRHLWDDPGGADVADILAGAHSHSEQVSRDEGTSYSDHRVDGSGLPKFISSILNLIKLD